MMKCFTGLFLILFLSGCIPKTENESETLSDPFFGLEPTDSVHLLLPGVISSGTYEYNGTFSPDGSEFYYTLLLPNRGQIVGLKLKEDNTWVEPTFAAFSSPYSDVDPIFSPDGSRLYFTSNRPTSDTSDVKRNNIWYVEKDGDGWSSPQFVALTETGDYYSSITNNGDIYFNTWSNGDIYKAIKIDSSYLVERLPDAINLDKSVGDPFISPNEDYLIFRGNNLKNTTGGLDLYISFNLDNQWTEPINLGEPINTKAGELCPYVTADGKLFIFASNRLLNDFDPKPGESIATFRTKSESFDNGSWNIYYTSTDFIERLRKKAMVQN
ncbi:MAG: TolB family protein [Bacteroidota bacterium]